MNLPARRRGQLDDIVVLVGLLLLAAALRLPDLATRGTWDSDQGHDMLVLRQFVQGGVIPLLGPPTSIGDVHHGAWYYYLLAPAAALTGGDQPLAVVTEIALSGIAAVGVTWWLARSIGGPVVGAVAGLLLAVSAAAIDESTFLWNPNLIAFSSGVALAATWRAWSGHDGRWWVIAAIGTAVTMQCHILGVALLPIVGIPFLLDARRRPLRRVALAIVVVFVLAYLPLAVHELTTDFGELRAASAYLAAGSGGEATALPVRILIIALRVASWPLTGLIIDGFAAAAIATVAVGAVVAWTWRRRGTPEGTTGRWLGLGLLWTILFLAVAAPSLASVVRALPNDHYHAFADPMVIVLAALGTLAIVREVPGRTGLAMAALAVAVVVAWNAAHLPAAVHPDGGYPAARAAALRVDAAIRGAGVSLAAPVLLRSAPSFKSSEALAYPLSLLGRAVVAQTPDGLIRTAADVPPSAVADSLVVLCDALFQREIDAECGGPAETIVAQDAGFGQAPLLDRFEAAPGRWMSVYGPKPA